MRETRRPESDFDEVPALSAIQAPDSPEYAPEARGAAMRGAGRRPPTPDEAKRVERLSAYLRTIDR